MALNSQAILAMCGSPTKQLTKNHKPMKYFLDTEFIEGFRKPLFGKKRHFIDLISIAIVREDGEVYEAICSEYNFNEASPWVKENVIVPLYDKTVKEFAKQFNYLHNFHQVYGKTREEIRSEILAFLGCEPSFSGGWHVLEGIEFYGYYADYDWVLFCSLFGTMMDLPSGMPMYCRDLKQTLDEKAAAIEKITYSLALQAFSHEYLTEKGYIKPGTYQNVIKRTGAVNMKPWDLSDKVLFLKRDPVYPKQTNEHDAVADAKWNLELYKFLQKL